MLRWSEIKHFVERIMIPRLHTDLTTTVPGGFFERLIEGGFAGDMETGASSRTVYATDNSIYQVEPQAVLFPRGVEDLKIIATVLSEPAHCAIVIAPRGGGTGTNGQSLTSGIVVDCSRHMNAILEVDSARMTARVQAGVVKDQLNRALKPHGLFFAPELSTSNRATIGGMIATDACGQGSCLYGKTSNHVLGLRIVLMDGTEWWSRPMDTAALTATTARQDRIGEIYRTVERVEREKRARVAEVFPNLNRYMTGYDLAHIRRADGTFDLNAVLCGSEGTLALIAEAELNLLRIPAHAGLINIRYDNFNTALEDARTLTELRVASIETIDEKVLRLAKGDIVWNGIARFFPEDQDRSADGINIVEIVSDDATSLERKLEEVISALESQANVRHLGYTITRDHSEIEAIWSMRKRAVGLLGNVEGPIRPVPFVEDTAVPPENLASYIREFRAVLDSFGVSYGMFGHVDAGVLHVRPALDLSRDDHRPLVREISDKVVALTLKYGGVLWGEHGKGVRSEYVPEFFGDLYPSLQEIKRAFDPENRMNPGKIATPSNERLSKIDEVPFRGIKDRAIGSAIRATFDNAAYCNGNGACFDFDEASPMCPSYKATRDRRLSPKGRAALMREWLRLLALNGVDARQEAQRLRRGSPASFGRRLFNSLNPRNRDDFSHEVRAAMDSCLACKACAGQCPVKVSVPTFRSKFLELYYGRYLRPIAHPIIAAIETTLPVMANARFIYNSFVGTNFGRAAMRLVGLTALPSLPALSLSKRLAQLEVPTATKERLHALPPSERARSVIFVADAFTANFDPQVVIAAVQVARKLGQLPFVAPPNVNGKAMHVHGYLGRFEKAAVKSAQELQSLASSGATLVGLDPSMTLTYRSEYKSVPAAGFQATVLLPQEWLAANVDSLDQQPLDRDSRFRLMPHCTERTNASASLALWKTIFERLGVELEVVNAGCCGMAGTFGHETRNRSTSERLYEMSWKSEIAALQGKTTIMATGYSCRSQVKEVDKLLVGHPLQAINELLPEKSNIYAVTVA
jgi:FAD/FMN-containing dehydrogenase/Fe-S oxidoreductase